MKVNISTDPRLGLAMRLNDPSQIAQIIINVITNQLDYWAPTRRIQITSKQTTLTQTTKDLIARCNEEWKHCTRYPTIDNIRGYNHLKNQVKKAIKTDKIEMDRRNVAEAVNSRDYWKQAKKLIGWTSYGGPKLLVKNGKVLNSPREMANELNLDYVVRTSRAARNTPPRTEDPMISYNSMLEGKRLHLAFQPVGRYQLSKTIESIYTSKLSVVDGISMKLARQLKEPLLSVRVHLVNTSIVTATYPESLKLAKIVPLLKKGRNTNRLLPWSEPNTGNCESN